MKKHNYISVYGDALNVLKHLPKHSFDACIADPPYNMSKKKGLAWAFSKHITMQESWDRFSREDYFRFCYEWLREICRVVKPNGNIFVFGTFHNIYTLGFILQQLDRKILNSILWLKPNAQPNITCRMLTESSEQLIWVANQSADKASKWTFNYAEAKQLNGGKQMRNFWSIPLTPRTERVASHPSQKPEILFDRIVQIATKPGDWILDPFAGVGTALAVAHRRGRKCFLIERNRHYVTAQAKRFAKGGYASEVHFTRMTRKAMRPHPTNDSIPTGNFIQSFLKVTSSPLSL